MSFDAWAWWIGLTLLTCCRWVLCAKDEVLALPADSTNYAYLAVAYLSGLPTDRLPAQRPGLGLLAQASTALGIPYKVFLDGAACVVAYLAAHWIRRWTGSTAVGLVTYAALALNLWLIFMSQLFMSEPATSLVLVLLWLAAIPLAMSPPQQWTARQMWPAALASAGLVLLRPEDLVVYGYWLWVAAIALFRGRRGGDTYSIRQHCRWFGIAMLPIVAAWGTLAVGAQIHRYHYGIPAITQTDTPGMKALLNTLYTIDPTDEIRFAPVTQQTLRQACEQSPTFNKYRNRLLDTHDVFYEEARRRLGLSGEVGTWLNWHLVRSFAAGGFQAESDMQRAAVELETALQEGRLPKRWARFPIDPLWRQWIRDIPSELYQGLLVSCLPQLPASMRQVAFRSDEISPLDRGAFDDGLLRRRGARNDLELRILGRTSTNTSAFQRIRLISSTNKVLGSERILPGSGTGSHFGLRLDLKEFPPPAEVVIEFLGGDVRSEAAPRIRLPLSTGVADASFSASPTPGTDQHALESWSVFGSLNMACEDWRIRTQRVLASWRGALTLALAGICFGLGCITRLGKTRRRVLLTWLGMGWGLFCGRLVYYVLCEVWLHWGLSRYMGPNHFLAAALLGPSMFWLGAILRAVWLGRRDRTQSIVVPEPQLSQLSN